MDKAEKLPLLDRFLAYFWPTLALKRQRARLQLRFLAAASPSHNWGWRPYSEASLQETIAQEIPIVRKRVKELVMNFPAFAHIADMMAALVVGTGIKFRSKAKNAKGEVDSALSAQIESILSWALEELDVTGKFHGYELMRMAKREMIRSGEFLFIKTSDRDPKRCVPYCLLMVDPVELSSIPANGMRKGAEFLDGI
ncbi:MAG: phage portal protein, partial [Brevinematales bacterium]